MKRVKPQRRRGFTRLSSKRQVTLPVRVVDRLNLQPGDQLRVDAEDGRIVLTLERDLAARRREVIAETAGSLPGVWRRGDLERLRNEWR